MPLMNDRNNFICLGGRRTVNKNKKRSGKKNLQRCPYGPKQQPAVR